MSFKAVFKFDGGSQDYDVVSFNYSIGQSVDEKGRPSSNVQSGNIFLQVESTDDNALADWMIDPFKPYGGSITLYKRDNDGKLKEISFKDGYCVGYSESFNQFDNQPSTISINITAREIMVGDATLNNRWPM